MTINNEIVITGGLGFIGLHLTPVLIDHGYSVHIIDKAEFGVPNKVEDRDSNFFKLTIADLNQTDVLTQTLMNCSTVIHLAANSDTRRSTFYPQVDLQEGICATFSLTSAMKRAGVNKLLFASSQHIYGPSPTPSKLHTFSEDSPYNPISSYGSAKASSEMLIRSWAASAPDNTASVLRFSNVVGSYQRVGIIPDLMKKASRADKILPILGDGNQCRNYIHVSDAVKALLCVLDCTKQSKCFEPFNIGSQDFISAKRIAEIVVEHHAHKKTLQIAPEFKSEGWQGDITATLLAVDKIMSLGWAPELSSEAAVRLAVQEWA